jgi:hypothetical protein
MYQPRAPRRKGVGVVNVSTIEILDLGSTSMLAQVLQIFLGKEHLVKNWLSSTLYKVVFFKGTIFQWSTKPLFTSQSRVEVR